MIFMKQASASFIKFRCNGNEFEILFIIYSTIACSIAYFVNI